MKERLIIFFIIVSWLLFPQKIFAETYLPEEPGTYPVKVSYIEKNKTIEKVVYVTVRSKDTIIVGDIAIDAKDFSLTPQQAKKVTIDQAIKYGKAKAWSTIDGSEKLIDSIDLSKVSSTAGVYDVTYSTNEQASKTVKVTVVRSLLENYELNSYGNKFKSSYWQTLLTIGFVLTLILLTPLLIVIFSSRNILKEVKQLSDLFLK